MQAVLEAFGLWKRLTNGNHSTGWTIDRSWISSCQRPGSKAPQPGRRSNLTRLHGEGSKNSVSINPGKRLFTGLYNSEWHLLIAASVMVVTALIGVFCIAYRYQGIVRKGCMYASV